MSRATRKNSRVGALDVGRAYAPLTGIRAVTRNASANVYGAGDSIMNGAGSSNAAISSFGAMASKILGTSRLKDPMLFVNNGVPGQRSDQILARIPAILANNPTPGCLFVLAGTNDGSSFVSVSTFAANITAIKALTDAANVPLVLSTVPPRSSTYATQNGYNRTYNTWLRLWCRMQGVPLADSYKELVDVTTGYIAASYDSGDGTHPNDAGHLAMAAPIAAAIGTVVPPLSPWPVVAPGGGLYSDPLMASGSMHSIAGPGTPSFSTTAASNGDLPAGQWLRITANSGAIEVGPRITSGYSPGDKMLICIYRRGVSSALVGKLQIKNDSGVVQSVLYQTSPSNPGPSVYTWTVPNPYSSPAFSVGCVVSPAGTVEEIGAFDIFNLTALGLESMW